jgi:hypothetical protein
MNNKGVINKSKTVETINFNRKADMYKWIHNRNIEEQDFFLYHLTGYNRVEYVINIKDEDTTYVVLKRFDNDRNLLASYDLISLMEYASMHARGKVANAKIHEKSSGIKELLITDNEMKVSEHLPSTTGIGCYLYEMNQSAFGELRDERDRLVIKRTNMTDQQFQSLISKLRVVGAQVMLVDINTIITINNDKILIYTKQKDVIGTEQPRSSRWF